MKRFLGTITGLALTVGLLSFAPVANAQPQLDLSLASTVKQKAEKYFQTEFVDLWVSDDVKTFVVAVAGDVKAAQKAVNSWGFSAPIVVVESAFSRTEIDEAVALVAENTSEAVGIGPDYKNGGVLVDVLPENIADEVVALNETDGVEVVDTLEQSNLPDEVPVVVSPTTLAISHAETWSNGYLRGGKKVVLGYNSCSATTLVEKGATYLMVASHCARTGTAATFNGANLGKVEKSAWYDSPYGSLIAADAEIIGPVPANVLPPEKNSIISTSTANLTVKGWDDPVVGTPVCISGALSGKELCGKIVATGFEVNYGEVRVANSAVMNFVGTFGDSGAPVYYKTSSNTAVVIGVYNGADHEGRGYFSPLRNALKITGATAVVNAPQVPPTQPPATSKLALVGGLGVSGKLYAGNTLAVSNLKWNTTGVSVKYEWKAGSTLASQKSSLVLTSAHVGKAISLRLIAEKSGWNPYDTTFFVGTVSAINQPAFSKVGTPKIKSPKTPKVGNTLTVASHGSWSPTPTSYTYQWYRNGAAIVGATGKSYTLVAADRGKTISLKLTAQRSDRKPTASKMSAKTKKIAYGTLTSKKPTISGTKQAEATLTANPGIWTAGTVFSYQWYRGSKAIKGATGQSYKLTSADVGKKLKVKVTGKRAGYINKSVTSSATAKIAKKSFVSATLPLVEGVFQVGKTLTVSTTMWTPAPTSYSYQWLRSGKTIPKATGRTYKLTKADLGKSIAVKVTAKRAGYANMSVTSVKVTVRSG
ncbi:MAG: S1 family peptidase [Propionibacteriaceae bacterium]|nr:S1 family peptidase [Propionibacteriaceae bacterium]